MGFCSHSRDWPVIVKGAWLVIVKVGTVVLEGALNHTIRYKCSTFLASCLNTHVPVIPGGVHGDPGVSSCYCIRFILLLIIQGTKGSKTLPTVAAAAN